MTRRVLFRPEAEAELIESVAWYESRAQGLGAEFIRALEATVASVERHPTMYPIVFSNARRAVLRRFPYSLIYVESGDDILVVACSTADAIRVAGRIGCRAVAPPHAAGARRRTGTRRRPHWPGGPANTPGMAVPQNAQLPV